MHESDGVEGELLKIRPMKLTYHLDDETISLYEPHTTNSGHLQAIIGCCLMSHNNTRLFRVECLLVKRLDESIDVSAKII